jgi:N12 class adenine-specific DNA methylase
LVAFITSMGVLDSPDNEYLRRHMASVAEFMGAIRLPNTSFKANANTEVATDIIFLRKFNEGEPSKQNHEFISHVPDNLMHYDGNSREAVRYNEYFKNNPDMVIGELRAGGLQSRSQLTVEPPKGDFDIQKEIEKRAEKMFPQKVYTKSSHQASNNRELQRYLIESARTKKPGNLVVMKDGKVAQIKTIDQTGSADAEELRTTEPKEKLKAFIDLRDRLNQLYAAELSGADDSHVGVLRQDLNKSYDSFVKKYGVLNSKKNAKLQVLDVDGYNVFALESVGEKGIAKADIFSKRIIKPFVQIDKADSVSSAIPIVLNEDGYVNMDRISELLGKTPEEILEGDGKGKIFLEPSGGYSSADEYLSGNVRDKLKEAEKAAALDPRFQVNVEKLREVIPQDLRSVDIEVRIGARWVPAKYYEQFAQELFNNKGVSVQYFAASDTYKVNARTRSVELDNKYGTRRKSGDELLDMALHGQAPQVVDYVDNGNGGKKAVLNEKETAAAVEKYNLIRDEFKNWLWKDEDRRAVLGRLYNDRFNSVVKRTYDGSHLSFPGLSFYEPKPHQKDGTWMLLQNNGGIIDHIVGGGKTLIMQMFAIEAKRMGIAKKPMIIALKSTIPQISSSFAKAYPLAKVLAPKASDFEAKNRKAFLAKIANNDYDCIVISHENYAKIQHDAEVETELINEELYALEKDIEEVKASGNKVSKQMLSGLQQRKQNLEARLKKLKDTPRDTELRTFQELGIDHLITDESHQFKNLTYNTKMQGIAGMGDAEGSKRAFNLLIGIRSLQQMHRGDKGVSFFSGTPISNSIVEMYLLLKYLRPRKLKELGMTTFDSWVTTFASNSVDLEFSVTGALANKNRFREFVNVPELAMLYNEIADVRTSQNLKLPRPEFKKSYTLSLPEDMVLEKMPEPGAIYEVGGNKLKIYAAQSYMKGRYDIRGTYINKPTDQAPLVGAQTIRKISGEGPDELSINGFTSSDYIIKNVKQSKLQQDYSQRIIRFAKEKASDKSAADLGIRMTDGKKKSFMLLATDLSSKLAIDMRLIFPQAQDFSGGKLHVAADTIFEHYKESQPHLGVQLVFSDKGTPSTGSIVDDLYDVLQDGYSVTPDELRMIFGEGQNKPPLAKVRERMAQVMEYSESKISEILQEASAKAGDFNIYSDLKAKLIQRGIPAEEIAFIHDYKSDKQKENLFNLVNSGKIRVVLGSTQKLGTGVNVQDRIIAMHHIDVPWRPSDMEQRNGRGVRQGNIITRDHYNNELPVYAYATEQTLDAYKYQLLATKQYYIDQLKSGAIKDRVVMEGADEESMGMQEMVAILSGNPDILEMAKVQKQLQALETSKKNFDQSIYDAQYSLKRAQDTLRYDKEALSQRREDWKTVKEHQTLDKDGDPEYRVRLFDIDFSKPKEAGQALLENEGVLRRMPLRTPRKIGEMWGLSVIAESYEYQESLGHGKTKAITDVELSLKGASASYKISYSSEPTAKGVALRTAALGIKQKMDAVEYEIEITGKKIEGLNEFINTAKWGKDEDLAKLKARSTELQRRLNESVNDDPGSAPARREFGFSFSDKPELSDILKRNGSSMKEAFNVDTEDQLTINSANPIAVVDYIDVNGQEFSLYLFNDRYKNKIFRAAPRNEMHEAFFDIKAMQIRGLPHAAREVLAFDKEFGQGEYERLNELMPGNFQERLGVPEADRPESFGPKPEDEEGQTDEQRLSNQPKFTQEQQQAVQKVLSRAFPGVKSVFHTSAEDYLAAARDNGIGGAPNAFVDREGVIHYSPSKVYADTQLHENGHILTQWAKKYVPSFLPADDQDGPRSPRYSRRAAPGRL